MLNISHNKYDVINTRWARMERTNTTMNLEDPRENKRFTGESCACNFVKITLVYLFGFEELSAAASRPL